MKGRRQMTCGGFSLNWNFCPSRESRTFDFTPKCQKILLLSLTQPFKILPFATQPKRRSVCSVRKCFIWAKVERIWEGFGWMTLVVITIAISRHWKCYRNFSGVVSSLIIINLLLTKEPFACPGVLLSPLLLLASNELS